MLDHFKLWAMGGFLSLSVILAKQLIVLGFHPIYVAMLQAAGSTLFLASLGITGLLASLRSKFQYYLWASALGFTIPQLVVFYSVEYVGASVAALAYAFPLFITFFLSALISKTRPAVKPVVFMLGAFIGGLLYLYKPDVLDFNADQIEWLILLCIAPVVISIANVYRSTHWPSGVPVYQVALLTNAFSLGSYSLFAVYELPALPDFNSLTPVAYLSIVIFMLIAALGQYLLFSLQKSATPAFVSQTGSIATLCGGILGFLFFQESYQITTLLGSLLIFVGVAGFSRVLSHESIRKNAV